MFNLDTSYMKLLCLQKGGGGGGKLSKIFLDEWSLTVLARHNSFIKIKSSYFAFLLLFQLPLYSEVVPQDFMCVKINLF